MGKWVYAAVYSGSAAAVQGLGDLAAPAAVVKFGFGEAEEFGVKVLGYLGFHEVVAFHAEDDLLAYLFGEFLAEDERPPAAGGLVGDLAVAVLIEPSEAHAG